MGKEELIWLLTKENFPQYITEAFRKIEREKYVPKNLRHYAYYNTALPTSEGQTISQPSCIAMMLFMLELDKLSGKKQVKILEIGSGTGYVLALISEMLPNAEIYGIEIKKSLAERSSQILKSNKKIKIINGSGFKGYKKEAPFDRILISASAPKEEVVEALVAQLKLNGIVLSPVGSDLVKIKKTKKKIEKAVIPNAVIFVPLVEK